MTARDYGRPREVQADSPSVSTAPEELPRFRGIVLETGCGEAVSGRIGHPGRRRPPLSPTPGSNFVVSLWVRCDRAPTPAQGYVVVIGKYSESDPAASRWLLGLDTSLRPFMKTATTSTPVTASRAVEPGIWRLLVAQWASNGTCQLYVDTNLCASGSLPLLPPSDLPLTVGDTYPLSGAHALDGGVDDVSITRRLASPAVVAALFRSAPDTDHDGVMDGNDPDDNNDGIPDAWAVRYFGDRLAGAPGEDPDGDGCRTRRSSWPGRIPFAPIRSSSLLERFLRAQGRHDDDRVRRRRGTHVHGVVQHQPHREGGVLDRGRPAPIVRRHRAPVHQRAGGSGQPFLLPRVREDVRMKAHVTGYLLAALGCVATAGAGIVDFGGRLWRVRETAGDPGENQWSTNCVWTDAGGQLHLQVRGSGGQWYSGEIESERSANYGEYRWYTTGRLDSLDPNVVAGLFTFGQPWDSNEIDFEFTYGFDPVTNNFHYTIQPWYEPGHMFKSRVNQAAADMTHSFVWAPRQIRWRSWYGHCAAPSNAEAVAADWTYTGDGVPADGQEHIYINTWLANHTAVTINESNRFQAIEGFGASLTDSSGYLLQYGLTGAERTNLLRSLFSPTSGIGLSYLRQPVGGSDFRLRDYTFDDMPAGQTDAGLTNFSVAYDEAYTIPLLKAISGIQTNLKIIGTPWSAPAWMKDSGSLYWGELQPGFYPAYAAYFRKYVQAYAARGIPVNAVTLQNEPLYEPYVYPGMYMDATNQARLAQLVAEEFRTNAIGTQLLCYDHNWDEYGYPLAVYSSTGAAAAVARLGVPCLPGRCLRPDHRAQRAAGQGHLLHRGDVRELVDELRGQLDVGRLDPARRRAVPLVADGHQVEPRAEPTGRAEDRRRLRRDAWGSSPSTPTPTR